MKSSRLVEIVKIVAMTYLEALRILGSGGKPVKSISRFMYSCLFLCGIALARFGGEKDFQELLLVIAVFILGAGIGSHVILLAYRETQRVSSSVEAKDGESGDTAANTCTCS